MPVRIFFSYSHEDEQLRNELEKHLRILQRQGKIISWSNRETGVGQDWAKEINSNIRIADIILLLISPGFMDSDYCYSIEMTQALERHKRSEAYIIPIILRAVDWKEAPFSNLHCLPSNGKPITSWHNLDEAFFEVAEGIRKVRHGSK
ncbi:MAG: toll/interleukin-1 receptor domain-containing protein [Chloroflexota bacterium]|nr:toll/interleukin-1 receptor domain-containing protein [Chloroflexota bacterium]